METKRLMFLPAELDTLHLVVSKTAMEALDHDQACLCVACLELIEVLKEVAGYDPDAPKQGDPTSLDAFEAHKPNYEPGYGYAGSKYFS